jgi:NAD(P) transhydrogenase subunit alpha
VNVNGVKVIGPINLAATVPTDASALYARNVLNFLSLSLDPKTGDFAVPRDDEIVKATMVVDNGAVVPRGG